MKEEIAPLLRELASELSTTTEYLWEVMVRQATIYAASHIAFFIIVFILLAIGIRFYYKKSKAEGGLAEYVNPNESPFPLMCATFFFGCSFAIVLGFVAVSFSIVTAILNPEYWALEQILKKL